MSEEVIKGEGPFKLVIEDPVWEEQEDGTRVLTDGTLSHITLDLKGGE